MATHTNCEMETALIKTDIEYMKRRDEEYRRQNERWQERMELDIQRLKDADVTFQRDATQGEKNKFGLWVTVVIGLGTVIIGSILTLLFSKF